MSAGDRVVLGDPRFEAYVKFFEGAVTTFPPKPQDRVARRRSSGTGTRPRTRKPSESRSTPTEERVSAAKRFRRPLPKHLARHRDADPGPLADSHSERMHELACLAREWGYSWPEVKRYMESTRLVQQWLTKDKEWERHFALLMGEVAAHDHDNKPCDAEGVDCPHRPAWMKLKEEALVTEESEAPAAETGTGERERP